MRSEVIEDLQAITDDSTIDFRLIDHKIATIRAVLMRQKEQKYSNVDENYIQDIFVEMDLVDRSMDNECGAISLDCFIVRSTKPIPNAVEFVDEKAVTRIGSVDILGIPFTQLNYDEAIFYGNGRYTAKIPGIFIKNNYVYLLSKHMPQNVLIDKLNVRGVWENPQDAGNFSDCKGKPCWTPESQYPINRDMWAIMRPMLLEDLSRKIASQRDENNNNEDDNKSQSVRNDQNRNQE